MATVDMDIWQNITAEAVQMRDMEILKYMSCSENTTIIIHYMQKILRTKYFDEVGSMGKIYRFIVKRHVKKNDVLDFLLEHYYEILFRFPGEFDGGDLLNNMIMNVYTTEQLDKIANFVDNLFVWNRNHSSALGFNMLINWRRKFLKKVLEMFNMF